MLPESVLKKAAEEMLDYQGTGQSVMEMSHRSKAFDNIIKDAEALLRSNEHSRQLQGNVPPGRRFNTVCNGSAQPYE